MTDGNRLSIEINVNAERTNIHRDVELNYREKFLEMGRKRVRPVGGGLSETSRMGDGVFGLERPSRAGKTCIFTGPNGAGRGGVSYNERKFVVEGEIMTKVVIARGERGVSLEKIFEKKRWWNFFQTKYVGQCFSLKFKYSERFSGFFFFRLKIVSFRRRVTPKRS